MNIAFYPLIHVFTFPVPTLPDIIGLFPLVFENGNVEATTRLHFTGAILTPWHRKNKNALYASTKLFIG